MSTMTGASMLRTRRKDVNLKPNRRLDRKSSRGMLYENEELRLRTININAEVERGQSDIKKLKRENEQLKREILALRYEYDRLDTMLRERKYSPEHSDENTSVCSVCPECSSACQPSSGHLSVVFEEDPVEENKENTSVCSVCPECSSACQPSSGHLSVVFEEDPVEENKNGVESPCTCDECQPKHGGRNLQTITEGVTLSGTRNNAKVMPNTNNDDQPNKADGLNERRVDVIIHDAPIKPPQFFEALTTPVTYIPPPPAGFIIEPYQTPKFHTGGNVEDLLGEVQANPLQTTFIQHNSVFMCNTKRITQRQCSCQKDPPFPYANNQTEIKPKCYVTEKNIELNYDYPRSPPVQSPPSPANNHHTTTTEVASTVVFVERRIPVRPKKFDFLFRSRSAPVGDNEEPIYATVNKLPKRLRKMELENLEREVAYKSGEPDSSTRTEATKTDSESQAPHQDDDTSPSEREKSVAPQRPDTTKAKKRKRFSLTFKKRERKRREMKKEVKNGVIKNGGPVHLESDSEKLIEHPEVQDKQKPCCRHRLRNTVSSSSSGARYKRDSYQEMTTSHSEHERTNSVCSSMNSLASACTHKSRKLSVPQNDGAIPWCSCWGAGCL